MMNRYEQILDIVHDLAHAKINKDANGGIDAQLDQLYGLGSQIITTLASGLDIDTDYLIEFIHKSRGD